MLNYLKKKQFLRYFTVRFTGMILMMLAGMGVSIVTARTLGVSGKGVYTLLYSTTTMITSILGLKLAFGQAYYKKEHPLPNIAGSTYLLSVSAGVVALIVSLPIVIGLKQSLYKGIPIEYLLTAVFIVPVLMLAMNLRSLLDANYRIVQGTVVQSSRPILFLIFFVPTVVAGNASVGWAVTAIVLSITGMLVLAVFYNRREVGLSQMRIDGHITKGLLRFSLSSHLGLMFAVLQNRFDIFIVAYFMTAREVGLYSIALALAEVLGKLSRVAASVLLPRLAKEAEQKRSIALIAKLNRVIFPVVGLSILLFALCAAPVIDILFGKAFEGAYLPVLWLLPGILFQSLNSITHNDMIMRGRVSAYSWAVLYGLVTMVAADLVLIPVYGLNGAAFASSLGWIVTGGVVFTNVIRNNNLHIKDYFDFTPELKMILSRIK